jgi:hypothetical protein
VISQYIKYNLTLKTICAVILTFSITHNLYLKGKDQFYWWRKPEYQDKSHRPAVSPWQILSHNVISSTPPEWDSNSQL